MCLENLRTLVEAEDSLCFHLADIYRGKLSSKHWLQLIAITFCRQAEIHILYRLTYTLESPIAALEALSIVHYWSCIQMGDRPLRRTIWEDRRASFRTLDSPTDRRPRQCRGKMADNAAEDQTKLRPLDKLLQHRHLTSPRHNSTMMPSGHIIIFCNSSLRHSRIWARKHISPETISRHCHTLNSLFLCTLEYSNLSPVYQSFQQTSIAPRNSTRMPHSPLTPASPT